MSRQPAILTNQIPDKNHPPWTIGPRPHCDPRENVPECPTTNVWIVNESLTVDAPRPERKSVGHRSVPHDARNYEMPQGGLCTQAWCY